jgi:hypothetical protein
MRRGGSGGSGKKGKTAAWAIFTALPIKLDMRHFQKKKKSPANHFYPGEFGQSSANATSLKLSQE